MITVQIVDDHKMFVEGLEKIINESDMARIVGTAYTAEKCWRMLLEQQADVLLLDIHLPDSNGIDLCAQIKAKYPTLHILALTSFGEYAVVSRMMENGAAGYILKNAMVEEILEGIETVAGGEEFMCEEVNLLLKRQAGKVVMLTGRERELLQLIAEGYINTEIADKMCLGVETINSYRKNLLFKLNVRNTAALVRLAFEEKLI